MARGEHPSSSSAGRRRLARTTRVELIAGDIEPEVASEELERTCTGPCKQRQPIGEFNFRVKAKDLRHRRCRTCMRLEGKKHYAANVSVYVARAGVNRRATQVLNRLRLRLLLSGLSCKDCAAPVGATGEFDHVAPGKDRNVSDMLQHGLSWATVIKEISLCEVLCPNCHRLRTVTRAESYRQQFLDGTLLTVDELVASQPVASDSTTQSTQAKMRRVLRNRWWLLDYFTDRVCVDCGENDLRVFELDHVRGTKIADVSKILFDGLPVQQLENEAAKCDVRCASCHRKRSANLRSEVMPIELFQQLPEWSELSENRHAMTSWLHLSQRRLKEMAKDRTSST